MRNNLFKYSFNLIPFDDEYLFQEAKKQLKILPIKKDPPWNIIIFIMESV